MMKNFVLFSLLLLSFFPLKAQNGCGTSLSNYEFGQKKQYVVSQYSEPAKLNAAINLVKSNCLTAAQVKDLAMVFREDFNRLELAKAAYGNAYDRSDFYEVYDAFQKISTAIRLNEYIHNYAYVSTPINTVPNTPVNAIEYPSHNSYVGIKGCDSPMSESAFMTLSDQVKNYTTPSTRLIRANSIAKTYCKTAAQAMKLAALMDAEADRLEVLKNAYEKTYDQNNIHYASQLLGSSFYKDQWHNFLRSAGENVSSTTGSGLCVVSQTDMTQIKEAVSKESTDTGKKNMISSAVRSYPKCFTIDQVREIVSMVSIDGYRLEIAKFMFDYTRDDEKQRYYVVSSDLKIASYRKQLNDYVENRR